MGKRLVYAAQSNRDSSPLSIGELACAGAFSAVPATLVAGPAERVKVLLQVRLSLNFRDKRRKVEMADGRCRVKLEMLYTPDLWMLLGSSMPRAV
jgi:hypothetical protein